MYAAAGPEEHGREVEKSKRLPVLAITGPTATGKTALALRVAAELPAEIVSADAMAVYRGMDIGTAKPAPEQRARACFHLLDCARPDESYSLARFLDDARAAIAAIHDRGRLPIICGGTGLYVSALLRGYSLVPQDPASAGTVRAELLRRLQACGLDALVADLRARDPEAAGSVDLRNPRRVLRALEISLLTGRPIAEVRASAPAPPFRSVCVVITCPRRLLYRRIDRRVEEMLAAGWLDEVRRLLDQYGLTRPLQDAIGYSHLVGYLRGEASWDATVEAIKRDTRRYAKRQLTWWRRHEEAHWMAWETGVDFGLITTSVIRIARRMKDSVQTA
ncbi:MAG: tRNA (adenosine(37)-N6)-dimethylallyltransferase MiaA [Armatimonadetes bacterium]|nr:tRNA (adenosine(37)-N6)-dimethylallyltransferase MiaA [Armatimonadota bacterium]